jgi:hypothetical protein
MTGLGLTLGLWACGTERGDGPLRSGADTDTDVASGDDVAVVDASDATQDANPALDVTVDPADVAADAADSQTVDAADAAPTDVVDAADTETDADTDAADVSDGSGDGGMVPDSGGIGDTNIDLLDPGCVDFVYTPGPCVAPLLAPYTCEARNHVADDVPIAYEEDPPACGPHRGQWARWGEYSYLPPQRWLHNLEHGGIALLYHPCAPSALVDQLRTFATTRAPDEGGNFRWVLTPYPELPTAIGLAAWGERYLADCFELERALDFVDRHYRQAPEDVGSDGAYSTNWIGRGAE